MTEKQDYKPAWLARIEAMRDMEVVSVLKTEAKTDTIGRWIRSLRRKYRIREHDDFTLVLCGKVWPKGKARGASYKAKEEPDDRPVYDDMRTAQWDAGVRQVDEYSTPPAVQTYDDYEDTYGRT